MIAADGVGSTWALGGLQTNARTNNRLSRKVLYFGRSTTRTVSAALLRSPPPFRVRCVRCICFRGVAMRLVIWPLLDGQTQCRQFCGRSQNGDVWPKCRWLHRHTCTKYTNKQCKISIPFGRSCWSRFVWMRNLIESGKKALEIISEKTKIKTIKIAPFTM